MATKLKGLKVTKVDFVDAGANPDADIMLYKNKDGVVSQEPKQEQETVDKPEGMLKRFFSAIGKAVGMKPEEINATIEEIQKGSEAETFSERMYEVTRRKITEELWDICYALESSMNSIICDDETEGSKKEELMKSSLDDFMEVMTEAIGQWAAGNTSNVVKKSCLPATPEDIRNLQIVKERVESLIEKAASGEPGEKEGELENMGIDKSKMTEAERVFYEDLEKRYGGTNEPDANNPGEGEGDDKPVEKSMTLPTSATGTPENVVVPAESSGTDELYKGLNPLVAEELKELKKFRETQEEKELNEVAKKYEIIGKKREELVPMLKGLKALGGTAYADMIAVLDTAVDTVEKSGAFTEIGKRGADAGVYGGENEAIAKVKVKATELMKSRPELTIEKAMDEVLVNDEQLRNELDK